MRPVGIGETVLRDMAKHVMRVAEEQEKTVCGNLHLCAGLEDGIEGTTHTVGQRRLERARVRRSEEEARRIDEEEILDVEAGEERLAVVTVGTE